MSLYGFDTHSDQVMVGNKTTGVHANLLQSLSDAVLAFQRDLEGLRLDDRVLGMTFLSLAVGLKIM